MRHWSQLAIRNSLAKPVRTLGAILAIALGVGCVVWVACCYESFRRTVAQWAGGYIGKSQINVESTLGKLNPFPERAVEAVRKLSDVYAVVPELTQRLSATAVRREMLDADREHVTSWTDQLPVFDLQGIDAQLDPLVRTYELRAGGRGLADEDQDACVVESTVADSAGVGIGDVLLVWSYNRIEPYELTIVGLLERRRIARFQKPLALLPLRTLQEVSSKYRMVTGMDVLLKEDDPQLVAAAQAAGAPAPPEAAPSATQLRVASDRIRQTVLRFVPTINIRDASARIQQIENAQSQQELVLELLSSVALLTSLFIILSTLSMGMIERIAQLGLLRCVGMTRGQLSRLILYEVGPLGAIGVGLGVPIGLGLTWLTVRMVPDWFGGWAISQRGILMAVVGGLGTTLVAAALPAFAATSVTPLEASRPRARKPWRFSIVLAALLAGGLLAAQAWVVENRVHRSLDFVYWSSGAVVLLYIAYALLAPLGVWLAGGPAVAGVAGALGMRRQLLQDQIGHAIWRSAGICCGMMVGLSLIVAITVFNSTFRAGWQFPKKFPAAYLWSFEAIGPEQELRIADVPGLGTYTVASAQNAWVVEKPFLSEQLVKSVTWFLGCDPDTFFDLLQLEFMEGQRHEALDKLRRGGFVIVADDFARTRNKHLGDKVRVWIGNAGYDFEVAGVVDSPALDVAASYFQAESEMRVAAVGSVIGAREDLKRFWRIDTFNMVLLNFDLPESAPPAGWPPPPSSPEGLEMPAFVDDQGVALPERWSRYREWHVLSELKRRAQAHAGFSGTVSELKLEIDSNISRMTSLLVAVPLVALIVAALGVANLMTANVASRMKQIAILRAVGATRGQVLRMVIGESLVLGLLGGALGLALGLHLAYNTRIMTTRMWGFDAPVTVPWDMMALSLGLTVGLCLLAGTLPARHAARSNVIDALHVA